MLKDLQRDRKCRKGMYMLCGVVMIYNILSIIIVVIRHQFLKIDVLCYKERVTALGQSSSSARNFGFQNTSGWAGWLNTPLYTSVGL